jgi:hypothetical protein
MPDASSWPVGLSLCLPSTSSSGFLVRHPLMASLAASPQSLLEITSTIDEVLSHLMGHLLDDHLLY